MQEILSLTLSLSSPSPPALLSPFRALHLFSGWEQNMIGITHVGYSSSVLTNNTTKWIYVPKIPGGLFSENTDAEHWALRSSLGIGSCSCQRERCMSGLPWGDMLVLRLLKCKTVSTKIICSLPNERQIQQIYSPVLLKKRALCELLKFSHQ